MPRSPSSSSRRSRSPFSNEKTDDKRRKEYRVHIADLPIGVEENEIRKTFQQFGTLIDVWVASASCFAFVVYKYKEDAQKAINKMDRRSFGNNRLKVTWARPRTQNRAHHHDPNMRCYKCGERGHISRECERHSSHRHDIDYSRYSSSNYDRYSRSHSPFLSSPLPPPGYFHPRMSIYPLFPQRYGPYFDEYFANGRNYRYHDRR